MANHSIFNGTKQSKVNFIVLLLIAGSIFAVFYYYVQGVYLGKAYPYNTCLFVPVDRFNDFVHTYNLTFGLDPYFKKYLFNSNYYPLLHILFYPFVLLPSSYSFITFILLFIGLLFCFNYFYLKTDYRLETTKNALIVSICSYPVLFTIDRGSFEGFILILLAGFIIALDRKKETLACILLAAAISTKVYPAVFIVLLLSDRKYTCVVKTLLLVILFTLTSLLFFEGGFVKNFNHIFAFTQGVSNHVATSNAIQRGVSLFVAIKIIILKSGLENIVDIGKLMRIYMITVFLTFFVTAFLIWRFSFKAWEKSFLLVSMMLLFPHLSCDYKLVLAYLPLWLLVNDDTTTRIDYIYLAAIALLLIPKNYFLFQGIYSDSGHQDLGIGIFINVFLLSAVSISIVINALKRSLASPPKPIIP